MNDLKLERFKKESNTPNIKILLISFSFLLFFTLYFMIYKSHAFYRLTESNDVIKAKIGSYVYNINYDLDGGILPDGVSNSSTYSSVEETTITNPVKEGYTFKGWEGFSRNILNLEVEESLPSSTAYANTTKRTFTPNTYLSNISDSNYYDISKQYISNISLSTSSLSFYTTSSGYGIAFPFIVDSNKAYTLSYDALNYDNSEVDIVFYKQDGTHYNKISIAGSGKKVKNFSTPNGSYYMLIVFTSRTNNSQVECKDIQLEEGSTATKYDPYLKKDLIIPKFTRGDISLKAIWEPSTYTVTFDANGGTVDTASKEVKYHEDYDNLPTPVREGYTFLGWNGKNLFDVDSVINQNFVKNADNTYTITKNSITQRYANSMPIVIPANTNFYTSWELVDYNGTYSAPFQIYGQLSDYSSFYITNGKRVFPQDTRSFTIYQEGSMPDGTYTTIKNLMIEISDTQTEYEPYYITSDTKVVQAKDHTLKAIWRQN